MGFLNKLFSHKSSVTSAELPNWGVPIGALVGTMDIVVALIAHQAASEAEEHNRRAVTGPKWFQADQPVISEIKAFLQSPAYADTKKKVAQAALAAARQAARAEMITGLGRALGVTPVPSGDGSVDNVVALNRILSAIGDEVAAKAIRDDLEVKIEIGLNVAGGKVREIVVGQNADVLGKMVVDNSARGQPPTLWTTAKSAGGELQPESAAWNAAEEVLIKGIKKAVAAANQAVNAVWCNTPLGHVRNKYVF